MKHITTKLYCYDHKPVTENAESGLDSNEFHIEIKQNVVKESEDSKVVVASKAKKRKGTIAYSSDDSDRRKKRRKRKLPLKMTVLTPFQRVCQNR